MYTLLCVKKKKRVDIERAIVLAIALLGHILFELACLRKRLLLVFSVTPFNTDQNKNQNRSIDKVQNL